MKNIKRFGVSILAIILTLTMAIPVLAADPITVEIDGGTVTVTNSGGVVHQASDQSYTEYTLTIHKYDVTSPGDFTDNATGEWIDPTDSDSAIYGLEPLANVVFRITKVQLKSTATEGSEDLDDYEPVSGTMGTPVYAYTDADGEIEWTSLRDGIYKIEEILVTSDGNGIIFDDNSFLMQLPLTAGGEVLTDIHVYPKNQRLIEKELVEDDINGNVLPWKITVDIPSDIAGAQKLEVSDALDSRLVYKEGTNLSVYYKDKDGFTDRYLTETTHYTVTKPTSGNGNTLTIAITTAGFTELAKGHLGSGSNDPKLYIEFVTIVKLTEDELAALVDKTDPNYDPIENKATLDFTNEDGNNYTATTDPVTVPDLFAIMATKVDGKDNNETLPGAKFKIYTELNGSGEVTGPPLYDPSDSTKEWVVISDANGIIWIRGLTEGTYYLVETQAPDGYNLLTEYKEVVVNAATDLSSDKTENLIVTTMIENFSGFLLPITGSIGTLLFTVGGLALIGTAVVIFVISRKRKSSKRTNT